MDQYLIIINNVHYQCIINTVQSILGFPGGSDGKEYACNQIQVQPLGQEDPLEKDMATHSSILDWKIPWTEEPGRLHSKGSQRVGHD